MQNRNGEDGMEIVDLAPQYEPSYFTCLEEWSDEMKEAGNHKEIWYRKMKDKGVRVKLVKDDAGTVGGMIQYLPIEYSQAEGSGLYFISCIWVHGYKEGRGNFQGKGMGKTLLRAAEEDVGELGGKGVAAWGISLPFWMKAGWYKRQGYQPVDREGMQVLLMETIL
jgi:GNAT superfamily N-acetyltransferase